MSWEWECRLEIVSGVSAAIYLSKVLLHELICTSRVLYAHGVIERPLLLDK